MEALEDSKDDGLLTFEAKGVDRIHQIDAEAVGDLAIRAVSEVGELQRLALVSGQRSDRVAQLLRAGALIVGVHGSGGNFAGAPIGSISPLLTAKGYGVLTISTRQHDKLINTDNFVEVRRDIEAAVYTARALGYRTLTGEPVRMGPQLDSPTQSIVTPIVPVLVGDDWKAALLWRALYDAGVFTNCALHPAVPPGGALLRTSVMATHDRETLDRALDVFAAVKREFEAEHGPLPGLD